MPRQPNYLTLVRETGMKVHGVGKIGDIFAGQDIDESHPTKSNVDGITADREAPARARRRTDLHEPRGDGHALGTSQRSGKLPSLPPGLRPQAARHLLDALRPHDLLILTSDHGCDPTTPSTDHSREHALLLAYVQGKNAAGRIHEERVCRRRSDRERLARRKVFLARHPRPADRRALTVPS